jgi:hypothetical protein
MQKAGYDGPHGIEEIGERICFVPVKNKDACMQVL